MKKNYCVYVYMRPNTYSVEAESPEEAKKHVILQEFGRECYDIHDVEVMATCACGIDNDSSAEVCEDCGARL